MVSREKYTEKRANPHFRFSLNSTSDYILVGKSADQKLSWRRIMLCMTVRSPLVHGVQHCALYLDWLCTHLYNRLDNSRSCGAAESQPSTPIHSLAGASWWFAHAPSTPDVAVGSHVKAATPLCKRVTSPQPIVAPSGGSRNPHGRGVKRAYWLGDCEGAIGTVWTNEQWARGRVPEWGHSLRWKCWTCSRLDRQPGLARKQEQWKPVEQQNTSKKNKKQLKSTPIRLRLEATLQQRFTSRLETKRGSTLFARFVELLFFFNSCAQILLDRRKMLLLNEDVSRKCGGFTRATVAERVEAGRQSCITVSVWGSSSVSRLQRAADGRGWDRSAGVRWASKKWRRSFCSGLRLLNWVYYWGCLACSWRRDACWRCLSHISRCHMKTPYIKCPQQHMAEVESAGSHRQAVLCVVASQCQCDRRYLRK